MVCPFRDMFIKGIIHIGCRGMTVPLFLLDALVWFDVGPNCRSLKNFDSVHWFEVRSYSGFWVQV